MSGIAIEVHHAVRPEEDAFVRAGLDRFNASAGPFDAIRPLRCFARGASGQLLGGAVGHTWGTSAELGQLWVEDAHRRRGIGSRLIARFEAEAQARGATLVYFDTFSFHAPDFYRAHGYEIACELGGIPDGGILYIMRKELPAARS